jgi:hypothetical protein
VSRITEQDFQIEAAMDLPFFASRGLFYSKNNEERKLGGQRVEGACGCIFSRDSGDIQYA